MIRNILIVTFLLLVTIQADFVRDSVLKVVKDTTTCLMWQDDSDSKTVKKIWEEAIDYCENLDFAGFDDWRLPNINELYSIGDRSKYNPAIKDVFTNVVSNYYWSSTAYTGNIEGVLVLYFNGGFESWINKNNNYTSYVRCVRTEQ